ncbi:hypothetical protein QTN25_004595 [Entamoeba marina]
MTLVFSSEIHDMSPGVIWNKIKERINIIYINSSFDRFYIDPTGIGASIFTGTVYPEIFSLASCFGLQWN